MKNIYLFYSTPRSGSTPLGRILGHYLKTLHGHTYLEEYFHNDFDGLKFSNGEITVDLGAWKAPSLQKYQTPAMVAQSRERARMLLQSANKQNHRYAFKMFPDADVRLGPRFKTLEESSQVIYFLRRNLFDHLLSHLLSSATLQFYKTGGLKYEKASVTADEKHFAHFLYLMAFFFRRIHSRPRARIVHYEDFVEGGPDAVIRAAGFKREIDWTGMWLPERQNPSDKLSYFANPDQIVSWYKKSSLQKKFPI